MALVTVSYVKGRPGATTTAVGLAAVAGLEANAVVVEADPAGGDLALRLGLSATPSVVDLAAAARHTTNTDPFTAGQQTVRLGDTDVSVVVAPPGGAQTRAALPELTRPGVLTTGEHLVIADCGRLDPGSAAWPVLQLADVVLVLVRGRTDELAHLREHLSELVDAVTGALVVVLAAGGVYPGAEVSDVLTGHVVEQLAGDPGVLSVWGPLPADAKAAAVLTGELRAGRRWQRLPLMRAYADLLTSLHLPLTDGGVGSGAHRREEYLG